MYRANNFSVLRPFSCRGCRLFADFWEKRGSNHPFSSTFLCEEMKVRDLGKRGLLAKSSEAKRRTNWPRIYALSHKLCIQGHFLFKKFPNLMENLLFCSWIWIKQQKNIYKMKKFSGIILVVLGALLLVLSYFADFVDYNWYNVGALLIIIIGIIVHIIVTKKS